MATTKVLSNISNALMYPTYKCNVSDFERELSGDLTLYKKFGGKNFLEVLEGGADCSELEIMKCMKPILPKCLSLVNIKTIEGKRQAARMLISTDKPKVIPNSILYNPNGSIRVDSKRFKEFYDFIKQNNTDWYLGEIFARNSMTWMWNCYVVDESLAGSDVVELPIMVAYSSEKAGAKLWFVGNEGDTLFFMFSNVNLPQMLR